MQKQIDNHLVNSVMDFLTALAESRTSGILKQKEPSSIVLDAFRQSYQAGGLDEVDILINSINEAIKSSGGKEGFGEGAALQHAQGDRPAFLHVFFADFNTGKVLAREAISLKQSTVPSPE